MRNRDDDVKSGYTKWIKYDVDVVYGFNGSTAVCSSARVGCTQWIYCQTKRCLNGCSRTLNRRERTRTSSSGPGRLMYRLLLTVYFLHLCNLAAGDYYSGYMASIITNHTASACEGQVLFIRCPMMSTIDIQSAMFGRKVPSVEICPAKTSIWGSFAYLRSKESTNCEAVTSYAKTAADCDGRRYCGLLVHSRVFGDDPCPGTTKYLTVNYKCQLMPDEFKDRGSCDDETMVVHCAKVNYVIAVYNVTMTYKESCRATAGSNCSLTSESALDEVTARCHKRQRCTVKVSERNCFNFIHFEYACIPKRILTDRLPSSVLSAASDEPLENPFSVTTSTSPPTTTTTTQTSTTAPAPKEIHPSIRIVTSTTTTSSISPTVPTSTTKSKKVAEPKSPETQPTKVEKPTTTVQPKTALLTTISKATTTVKPTPNKKRRKSTHTPFIFRNHFETTTQDKKSAANAVPNPGQMNSTTLVDKSDNETTTGPMVVHADSNETVAFPVIRSLVALSAYIRENKEQVLIVFLSCICVGLFLTVCMLVCKIEEKNIMRRFRRKNKTEEGENSANEGTENARLLDANARQSQTGSSTASPGNVYSAPASRSNSNGRVNHIAVMNRMNDEQRRRKRRMRRLMNKWCSCCCRNAPWQRDEQSDEYQIEHRSTSLSDDDAISAVASGRSHFDVEPQPIFSSSSPAESPQREAADGGARYNAFPNMEHTSDEIPYADEETSEYEYQDNDVTPPLSEHVAPVRPTTLVPNLSKFSPAQSSSSFGNGAPNLQAVNRNPYIQRQQSPMRQGYTQPQMATREPPPFPKHTHGYQVPQQHNIPHYATQQRVPFNSPYHQHQHQQHIQPQRIRTNPLAFHTQQRHPTGFTSSFNEHYVSLQPQHQPASNARTVSLGLPEPRLERRGSWYDNSRESPMYEYFQRQGRPELPGTKNLNQYY